MERLIGLRCVPSAAPRGFLSREVATGHLTRKRNIFEVLKYGLDKWNCFDKSMNDFRKIWL